MAWNKEPIEQKLKPTPLPYLKWFLAIGVAILFFIYSLNIQYSSEITQQKKLFNIIISLLPLITILASFLYKYIKYINKKNIYYFLKDEKYFADKKWEDWGGRSVSIIDCIVLLPEKITIEYIENNFTEHIANYNIPKNIAYLDSQKSFSYHLLKSAKKTIDNLLEKQSIVIKYITNKNNFTIENQFISAWSELFENNTMPELKILNSLSYDYIEKTIIDNNNFIEIIIIDQNDTAEQSAALAIFIMASDDIVTKNNINVIANVKRPMRIDVDENYQDAINMFSEIQTESILATRVITDRPCNSDILVALFNIDSPLINISPDKFTDLEYFIGPTGDYSSWITMCLSVNFSHQYKKTVLSLSYEENNFYINTVTASK